MLLKRCKMLGGVLGLVLLLSASSPAFAQQQPTLTTPGDPSGDFVESSICAPWCNDTLSNQVINDQQDSQSQSGPSDTNGGNGGGGGGGICSLI